LEFVNSKSGLSQEARKNKLKIAKILI